MKASELKTIAASLLDAGAPALPTIVLTREVPLYEVEFSALEFAVEAKLPSSDWAALALARALLEVSPADIDAYLGLGDAVSAGILNRLLEEGLLLECSDSNVGSPAPTQKPGFSGFFERLFGATPHSTQSDTPVRRSLTVARKLSESRAPTSPVCRLSPAGVQTLERGVVAQRRVYPARLIFLAEPLLFLSVVDEKRQRHTQHRRSIPLKPDRVPEALRMLDNTFSLPVNERIGACGIESSIRGLTGKFMGIVPGTQWEVRPIERRVNKGHEQQMALIVIAGFPSSDGNGLIWRVYLRQHGQTQDCPHVDALGFLDPDLRSMSSLLTTINAATPIPQAGSLRRDGAFELRCDGALLPDILGEADRPDDTFLPAYANEWVVGLRVHGRPTDIEAGRLAFFEFLGRRDASLRGDFDGTCANVATSLINYWDENPGLPSADDAAINLWARAELRAALCMRRLRHDLIAPYEQEVMPE